MRYRLSALPFDLIAAALYFVGLFYAFGFYSRLRPTLPWHTYPDLSPALLRLLMVAEGLLVLIPCALLLVLVIRAISRSHLLLRTAAVAMLPPAFTVWGHLSQPTLTQALSAADVVRYSLPLVVPVALAAGIWHRNPKRNGDAPHA